MVVLALFSKLGRSTFSAAKFIFAEVSGSALPGYWFGQIIGSMCGTEIPMDGCAEKHPTNYSWQASEGVIIGPATRTNSGATSTSDAISSWWTKPSTPRFVYNVYILHIDRAIACKYLSTAFLKDNMTIKSTENTSKNTRNIPVSEP